MVKLRSPYLLLVFFSLLLSCQKEDAASNSYSDSYRFFISGNLNGIPFEYKAGEGDYFLETRYSIDEGVPVMTSELALLDSPKRNSFEVSVRGHNTINASQPFSRESAMPIGLWPYAEPDDTYLSPYLKQIHLKMDSTQGLTYHHWQYKNNTIAQAPDTIITANSVYENILPVTLSTRTANCESAISHHINLTEGCDASLSRPFLDSVSAHIFITRVNQPISSVKWFLNDTALSESSTTDALIYYNFHGVQTVRAEISFEGGCVKTVERTFNSLSTPNCLRDFTYSVKPAEVSDSLMRQTVKITYYDEAGTPYHSYYNDVPGLFEINSLSGFSDNDSGDPTSRFFFTADVILRSEDGSTVSLTNAHGSLAVAHP